MCTNCGCGLPHEDHGEPANITIESLQRAARANRQSLLETATHMLEAVQLYEATHDGADPAAERARGLASPAGRRGARAGGRGTPASES
ncbi:MAG: hypothetical protein FIA92_13100 [Chloroflexi bacterium]|nr:hypothetical protein [Chloroflexota bacterium]